MGWQDRNYNSGREQLNSFFSAPAQFLQWALPIYRSRDLDIRLHFWFVILGLFTAVDIIRSGLPAYYIPINLLTLFVAVILHELGHRIFARSVGGNHWEWILWPLGGMVHPTCPRTAKAVFIANIGGIAVSLPLGILAYAALYLIPNTHVLTIPTPNPFGPLEVFAGNPNQALAIPIYILATFATYSFAITAINLFPAFWFDGGHIWHAILWPRLGTWKALNVTCMAGMVLTVPFFFLSFWHTDLLGVIIWALIFADCFNRRRSLIAAGPGVLDDDEDSSYNYMDSPAARPHKKTSRRSIKAAKKRAAAEQHEQAQIDAILAKVKEQGLHSLTWWEKRALKKATERQRQRDLAERR